LADNKLCGQQDVLQGLFETDNSLYQSTD
jgi:hypothetical protein